MASCSKKKDAVGVLKNFVDYRFSMSQSKSGLMGMSTGAMAAKLELLSGDDFKKFRDVSGLKKKKMKINIKNCEPEHCYLTYTLTYSKKGNKGDDFLVEVKKIAEVKKEEGSWKIADVNNVKTFVDSKSEIDVSAEGPGKAP
jgi:hypothetical protein